MFYRFLIIILITVLPRLALAQQECNNWGTYDYASTAGPESIRQCLAAGHSLTETFGEAELTILHQVAAYSDNVEALATLVKAASELEMDVTTDQAFRTADGNSLLHMAVRNRPEMVLWLLDNGFDADLKNSLTGGTALHNAFFSHTRYAAIDALIASGASLNIEDNKGNRALDKFISWSDWGPNFDRLVDAGMRFTEDPQLRKQKLRNLICNEAALSAFASQDWDFTLTNQNGETLLHYAAEKCREKEIFSFLVANNVAINQPDMNGNTPLMKLIEDGSLTLEIVDTFAKLGADPMYANNDGMMPWQAAGNYNARNFFKVFNHLLDITDEAGQTIVHRAITASFSPDGAYDGFYDERIEMFIQEGADLNIVDNDGNTPLHIALDHLEAVEGYFDFHVRAIAEGAPNLTIANANGELPTFRWLKSWQDVTYKGAVAAYVVNVVGLDGLGLSASELEELQVLINEINTTPLARLQNSSSVGAVDPLLIALLPDTFDINALDQDGNSVLYIAAANGHPPSSIVYIVGRGADINFTSPTTGKTPLTIAITNGFDDLTATLLSLGADPNQTDEQGRAALHFLAERVEAMNPDILPYLTKAGADFSMRDNAGRLPIEIAKERLGDSKHLEPFEDADRAARSFWERWFQ